MLGKGITLTGSVTGLIGHARNFTFGGPTVDAIENTDADTAGYHRTFEAGLINSESVTFSMVYNDTYAWAIVKAAKNRVTECWKAQFASGARRWFWGFITRCGLTGPYDQLVEYDLEIKITGEIKSSSSSSSTSSSSSSS
jgi:predicted secreted protein